MSYDFNVSTVDLTTNEPIGSCDHQISFERYIVNKSDFRTLNYVGNTSLCMRAPINGASLVQVYIGGVAVSKNDPNYGWSLALDTNRLYNPQADTFYKIVFNNPVRLVIPMVEVSYVTLQQYCIKCSGLGVLNDFKVSSNGGYLRVFQTGKLSQKSLKWIFTSKCPFYPQFICQLKNYIGQKLGIQLTESDVQTGVMNALSLMQQVQQAQGTVQTLDPAEILKDIVSITAALDPEDPTSIIVDAEVSSYAGTTAPLGFTIQVN